MFGTDGIQLPPQIGKEPLLFLREDFFYGRNFSFLQLASRMAAQIVDPAPLIRADKAYRRPFAPARPVLPIRWVYVGPSYGIE